MAKLVKYGLVIVLFLSFTFFIANAKPMNPSFNMETNTIDNYPYINQLLLESSRYTQKESASPEVINDFKTKYTLSYTEDELETLGFEQVLQIPGEMTVYFELDSFSILVKNEVTGYFWSSRPEFQGISGTREDVTKARNLMNSGLWVEYVTTSNIKPAGITTDSLYSLAEVEYQNNGSITEEEPDHLRPFLVTPGTYSYRKVKTTMKDQTANSFTVSVDIKTLDIAFDVTISLIEGSIEVYIPTETIVETGDIFRLLSIQVFPYFGAAREDKMPGYIVIPDGVGALVRTNKYYNTYFQSRFYGTDYGYQTQTLSQLSIPMTGIVHLPGEHAYYVNITEGAENATLIASLWGSSSRYHRASIRYSVRQLYKSIINRAGEGFDTIADEVTDTDYRARYTLLEGEDASYVGMAKHYRDYLINQEVLSSREQAKDNIPIQLSYIMSDQEPAFIGTTRINMTSASNIKDAYDSFKEAGLTNQVVTLMGWSRDGFINREPYRTNVFDKKNLEETIDYVKEDGGLIYLDNDYVNSSEAAHRISYNRDVARSLNKLKMVLRNRNLNGQVTEIYFLYPERSLSFARDDQSFYQKLGVSGLSMTSLGSVLFSYYDNGLYDRSDSIKTYLEMAGLFDSLMLSQPNSYLLSETDGYLNLPITNAQYDYYTDLVPLLPIILKGSISYYTYYMNFNALGDDRLLSMVDFGVNPSYVLTEEDTYKMRYTPSADFYTTTRSLYQEEIIENYNYINDALKHVIGATIENREILETGLVKVTYSNNVIIYVNYNYNTRFLPEGVVSARSYKVVTL